MSKTFFPDNSSEGGSSIGTIGTDGGVRRQDQQPANMLFHSPEAIHHRVPLTISKNASDLLERFCHKFFLPRASILTAIYSELIRRHEKIDSLHVSYRGSNQEAEVVTVDCNSSFFDLVGRFPPGSRLQANSEITTVTGAIHTSVVVSDRNAREEWTPYEGPLRLLVDVTGHDADLSLEFDTAQYDEASVSGLTRDYSALLESCCQNPNGRLASLKLSPARDRIGAEEEAELIAGVPNSFYELFARQSEQHADRTAVRCNDAALTYRELFDKVDALACHLRERGVVSNAIVGIAMDRSSEMLVAMLAVLGAGGAYLPIDPAYPADRVAFMIEDAKPVLVITQTHLAETLSLSSTPVLALDKLDSPLLAPRAERLNVTVSPDDLAYVIYTSGSTGKPKGVQISQRALAINLVVSRHEFPIDATDVVVAPNTLSFDIATLELLLPLIVGAEVVVVSRLVAISGHLLAAAIKNYGATIVQATPSRWRLLLEAGWQGQPGLKIISGGEPLPPKVARELLARSAEVWNMYGPTEATIYASFMRVLDTSERIPVGKPLPGYTMYVLDASRALLPPGAVGELFIGGRCVAQGYLGRPELTSQRFVPDPFAGGAATMYATGDLARVLPNGDIDLLGRADNQIKFRGFRIELDEIESALEGHQTVLKSIVTVVDEGDDDQRLVAYVKTADQKPAAESELRAFVQRTLPVHMVPSRFITVLDFALTPSGKVDRKALESLEVISGAATEELELSGAANEESTAPTELELILLDCWRSVLRQPQLQRDDNFFELGGHSLLATRLFLRISRKLGRRLPIGLLIDAPTVRRLAKVIQNMDFQAWRCLVPLQNSGSEIPVFLMHHLKGDVLAYRELAQHFSPNRPVFGLQAPAEIATKSELRSIPALASLYLEEVFEVQPSGPYYLGGYSSGGLMAFEMASQLRQMGHEVGLLALIDASIDEPPPPLSGLTRSRKIVTRKACKVAFKLRYELERGPREFVRKRWNYLKLMASARRLAASDSAEEPIEVTMEQALLLAERAYKPSVYDGSAVLVRAHDEAWRYGPDPLLGWSRVLPQVEPMDLPGNHSSTLDEPKVRLLFEVMNAKIEQHEKEYKSL